MFLLSFITYMNAMRASTVQNTEGKKKSDLGSQDQMFLYKHLVK